jgi:type I restriction enzyme R subunit
VINGDIAGRYYQTRAVRRIGESFEKDNRSQRTGRNGYRRRQDPHRDCALADLLMRCNWAKRVLFLADRVALVNQAVGEFKKHLPDSSPSQSGD